MKEIEITRKIAEIVLRTIDEAESANLKSDIIKMVRQELASSTKITGVKPERLTFYYNYGEKKIVPVQYRGVVTPEDICFISNVEYQPDSVTIYASKDLLDSINVVYTETLNFTDFHDTLIVHPRLATRTLCHWHEDLSHPVYRRLSYRCRLRRAAEGHVTQMQHLPATGARWHQPCPSGSETSGLPD